MKGAAFFFSVPFFAVQAYAYTPSEVEAAVISNIEMKAELDRCAAHPRFQTYGLSPVGPCSGIVDRIDALRESDLALIEAGHDCTAGDLAPYALALVQEDGKFIRVVDGYFSQCEEEFGR